MPFAELELEDMRLWIDLHGLVWPDLQDPGERIARRLQQRAALQSARWSQAQVHLVRLEGRTTAICYSFHRLIAIGTSQMTVLALAGVCGHPGWRRQGLGSIVVRAAWARLGTPVTVSLFQTNVPSWYEGRGARSIDNPSVNTIGGGRAFWSSHAMIFPSTAAWTEQSVDLLGLGW